MTEVEKILAESAAQVVTQIGGVDVTRGELDAVFKLVANPTNWKLAIDRKVRLDQHQVELMAQAVPFFTGGAAEIFPNSEVDADGAIEYRVMGAGYYHHVGA